MVLEWYIYIRLPYTTGFLCADPDAYIMHLDCL